MATRNQPTHQQYVTGIGIRDMCAMPYLAYRDDPDIVPIQFFFVLEEEREALSLAMINLASTIRILPATTASVIYERTGKSAASRGACSHSTEIILGGEDTELRPIISDFETISPSKFDMSSEKKLFQLLVQRDSDVFVNFSFQGDEFRFHPPILVVPAPQESEAPRRRK